MENGLIEIKELTMTSLEIVDLINRLRKEEGNDKEKTHSHFMRDIRTELNTLQQLGLMGLSNFGLSSYRNSQNKEQPCYILNRDGILMMLNKESTYVRLKTIEYINALEKKLKEVTQPKLPQTYLEALEALVQSEKDKLALENKIQEDKPYTDLGKQIEVSEGNIKMIDYAKIINDNYSIKLGQNSLIKLLREHDILTKNESGHQPRQTYINRGYFEVNEYTRNVKGYDKLVTTTYITPKGQIWLLKKIKEFLGIEDE